LIVRLTVDEAAHVAVGAVVLTSSSVTWSAKVPVCVGVPLRAPVLELIVIPAGRLVAPQVMVVPDVVGPLAMTFIVISAVAPYLYFKKRGWI